MKFTIFSTKLAIFAAGLLVLTVSAADAQKGQGSQTGMGQYIVKPMTAELSGELVNIKTGPCEYTTGHAITGTHLFIRDNINDRVINIHLGDADAVKSYVSELIIGHQVAVRAFTTDLLEIDNYIAIEVESDHKILTLRDDNLRPVWSGFYQGRRGRW